MSEPQSPKSESLEQRIARLFESAGYEVSQVVGLEPGVVDSFATSRGGFVRTKTYWKAWETCPTDIDAVLEELEQARHVRGADRGLGVIMSGGLPVGYSTDLEGRTATVITYRRLVLELSDIANDVREFIQLYEAGQRERLYFPLRGQTQEGEVVDAAAYIEHWLQTPYEENLVIQGGIPVASKQAVVDRAIYLRGLEFQRRPEEVAPLVQRMIYDNVSREALRNGWAVPVVRLRDFRHGLAPQVFIINDSGEPKVDAAKSGNFKLIELLEPGPAEVEAWFLERLPVGIQEPFISAYRQVAPFRDLASSLDNLLILLDAMQGAPNVEQATLPEWLTRIVASYLERALQRSQRTADIAAILEDSAFEQFALGRFQVPFARRWVFREVQARRWVTPERLGSAGEPARFLNVMVRDYFVARRIVSEVRAGRRDILARYQFPEEYVLLFLAIIAPEVAAQATADRGAEMRATIEGEVERRLQLTLAHMLRRSAGAVRSHMKTIKRHISGEEATHLQHELSRIEQEISFQLALAERTRLLHEVPEEPLEGVIVAEVVGHIVQQLRDIYPQVQCDIRAAPEVRARAMKNGLREILFCLVENAFQAVAFAEKLESPQVTVQAAVEGDIVRIDVLDNGPGVAVEDRERIFEPHVTTKKGGGDKPMGTGMGLAIARRYAEYMGGKVGLDPNRTETCFYVQLVAWKE